MKSNAPPPTKAERARIKLIMGMSCAVCALHGDVSKRRLECHHIVRGRKRLGHWWTLPLCLGHHQGQWDKKNPQPAQVAISDGMKAFRRAHGGLDDIGIWQRLQVVLGLDDSLPISKIVPRRLPKHLLNRSTTEPTTVGEFMSNHSSHPGDSPIPEFVKRMLEEPLKGATGTFPAGQLTEHDEGAIQFAVANKDHKVIVDFGTPVKWLGMDPEQAMGLAQLLARHAREAARGTGKVLTFSL